MHRTRMRRLTRSIIHSNPNVCAGCSSSLLNKRACNGRVTGLLYSPISCVNHIILFQIYKCELVFWFSANEHHTLISKCRAKQKVQERCQSTSKLTTPLLYVSSSLPIKSHMLWYTSTRYSTALLGLINPFKNCFRLIEMLCFAPDPVNEN